jgi:dTMP kinase
MVKKALGQKVKGCLITFEGTEGAGKTIASKGLQKWLENKGFKVLWTREPTDSRIGTVITDILKQKVKVAEEALPLLFAADRADHTQRVITRAINDGSIILCDRYLYSSLAYQRGGMTRIFPKKWLEEINRYSLKPDLVFFLDIEPEEGLRRIGKGQRIHDDKFFEDLETQKRIRDAYYEVLNLNQPLFSFFNEKFLLSSLLPKLKALSAVDSVTVVSINASLDQATVQDIIQNVVRKFLNFKVHKRKQHLKPRELLSMLSNSTT